MTYLRSALLSVTLTLAALLPLITAQTPRNDLQIQFNSANELLANQEFTQALQSFEAIRNSGYESGPLYLNMGITATRLDSLGLAKYYFLNALRFNDVFIAATNALDFVNYELGRRGARLPELAWTRITRSLFFEVDHRFYIALGLIIVNIGVVLLVVSWLRPSYKKTNRFFSQLLMVIGVLMIGTASMLTWQTHGYTQGVQLVREAQVYEQPNTDSEIIQTGYEGFQYIIDSKRSSSTPDWYFVRMSNGSRGWIQSHYLTVF